MTPTADAESFGALLRRLRGEAGLTQEQLAEAAGSPPTPSAPWSERYDGAVDLGRGLGLDEVLDHLALPSAPDRQVDGRCTDAGPGPALPRSAG